jgi:hypothetical protein
MHRATLVIPVVTALIASTALAFDPPKRKSGLWEMNMSNSQDKSGRTMQMCVDEKTDQLMARQAAGMGKPTCSKNDMHKEGGKIIGESVCTLGKSTATTRSVFTGKFDSAYRVESKTTYNPPMMGMTENSSVIDAKWTGPCEPGQKPGDMIMPGMGTMNMNEMMKGIPKQSTTPP